MISGKEKILKELQRQLEIEGNEYHDLLVNLLNILHSQEEWRMLVNCRFHSYGKLSYESYRFYYPKQILLDILKLAK